MSAVTDSKKQGNKTATLNLLPVMNLVTILIPLLLMSAQLVQLAVIDSTVPAISPNPTPSPAPPNQLRLSLAISSAGFTLMGAEGILDDESARVPCLEAVCTGREGYDFAALQQRLIEIKAAHPDEELIILVPDERTPYEVIVATMDAAREDVGSALLFPNVTIAGGLSG